MVKFSNNGNIYARLENIEKTVTTLVNRVFFIEYHIHKDKFHLTRKQFSQILAHVNWSDPEVRARRTAAIGAARRTPESRAKSSVSMKGNDNRWKNRRTPNKLA